MQKRKISVCSDRGALVEELRERCAGYTFEVCEEASRTAILVVDVGHDRAQPERGVELARIILGDELAAPREFGEVRLSKAAFMESPDEWLAVAADLVDVQEQRNLLSEAAGLDQSVRELLLLSELEAVYARVSTELASFLSVGAGWLFLHEATRELFSLVHGEEDEEGAVGLSTNLEEGLHRAHEEGRRYVIDEGRLALPVFVGEDLIGAFVCPAESKPAEEMIDMALRYLDAVTAVLSNARHVSENRDLALRDDLTKAFNRRFFESYLDEEIERTRRYGSVFSIIFLDLDDLKTINNKHGHLVGSRVLQEVAKRVLLAVRTIDKVVRFGGDEFCIILPETDKDQATSVAMRVRNSMTQSVFRIEPDIAVPITASFGIASYPNHALTKEGLIRQADEAMYRVKSTTKNSIGVAGDFDSNRTETAVS